MESLIELQLKDIVAHKPIRNLKLYLASKILELPRDNHLLRSPFILAKHLYLLQKMLEDKSILLKFA